MKKNLFTIALLFIGIMPLNACKLTINNDTDMSVRIYDENDKNSKNKPKKLVIEPHSKRLVGKNPDVRADFRMKSSDKNSCTSCMYIVKQVACSQGHEIELKVSDIEQGKNSPLFTIQKGDL